MKIQTELFKDSQLFQLIVDASPAGMVIVDRQGLIVYANQRALDWLGYEYEELEGKSVHILVPDGFAADHSSQHSQYMSRPRARSMGAEKDLSARRKDGSEFPVDISLHPFESGGQTFVLANILDASQRIRAQLVPQERLAAIGEMIAGLAHESRNALQRARGCLDLLELDMDESREELELVRRIRKSLDDLEHNYDEVRNYAAPIVLSRRLVSVSELIQEAYDDLKCEFPDLRTRLDVQSEKGAEENRLDQHRIKQVFRNVLENAVHASPVGSTIRCTVCRTMVGDEACQVIEVSDVGCGIPEEVQEKIFEPFFTTKQSGTGLGLAICRRIIEAHSGLIDASGNANLDRNDGVSADSGTTIRISLPIV